MTLLYYSTDWKSPVLQQQNTTWIKLDVMRKS